MQRRELMKYTLVSTAAAAALRRPVLAAETAQTEANAVPDAHLTNPLTVPADGNIKVAFLISTGAVVIDFTGPWAVFESTSWGIGADHRMPFHDNLYTVGVSKEPIAVSSGMDIVTDYTFADAPVPDVVVVPAVDDEKLAPAALEWLRSVQKDADVVMSVCNGSYVLAAAGLLEGRKATAHHGGYGGLIAMADNVKVIRGVRWVEDGNIATAGGLSSGIDLALRVVERYFGRDIAKNTALSLEYQGTGWMHPESNAQWATRPVGTAERPLDPVCEMLISRTDAETKGLTWEFEGKPYYFCDKWCKDHFMAKPRAFLEAV